MYPTEIYIPTMLSFLDGWTILLHIEDQNMYDAIVNMKAVAELFKSAKFSKLFYKVCMPCLLQACFITSCTVFKRAFLNTIFLCNKAI